MTATLDHDRMTGRQWLTFPSKPDAATIAALKAGGWRWSGYRKAWHNPSKFAKVPEGIAFEDGTAVDYAAERSERLNDRAEKAHTAAHAAFDRAHAAVEGIPFGQPILVGHHSERHHRAALKRHDAAMNRGCEQHRKAENLDYRARSSARYQAAREDPGAIARRIERLEKDLAKMERQTKDHERTRNDLAWVMSLETGKTPTPEEVEARITENREERTRRAAIVRDELARARAELADAGGLPQLEVRVDDIVKIKTFVARVRRVNPKTLTSDVLGIPGPSWPLKLEKTFLRAVLGRWCVACDGKVGSACQTCGGKGFLPHQAQSAG